MRNYHFDQRQFMTVALITGANKGVGLAAARRLGQLGVKIWLGARSPERGAIAASALRAEGIDAEYVQIDVTRTASIQTAANRIRAASGVLDVLINNAAVMSEVAGQAQTLKPSQVSGEILQQIFSTNVLGPIAVIQAMLPLMRLSAAARIVNVSSRLGSFAHQTDPNWGPRAVNQLGYSSSKAALNMATVLFAYELRGTPVKINAVTPGIVATDLNGVGARHLEGRPGYAAPGDAVEWIVRCATLPEDGPSGGFFGLDGPLPW